MQNANKALINAAKGALDQDSQDALTNLFVGTADQNFIVFFDGIYKKRGRPTPLDIKKNNEKMYQSWDSSVQDISPLLSQIRAAYLLAASINHEKSEKDMVIYCRQELDPRDSPILDSVCRLAKDPRSRENMAKI